ncbi:hypothetical protein ACP275_14G021300 [Erythranthe tilingii]
MCQSPFTRLTCRHKMNSTEGIIGIMLAVLFVCGNVAFFSIGIGPVCWVVSSDIFPLSSPRVRLIRTTSLYNYL